LSTTCWGIVARRILAFKSASDWNLERRPPSRPDASAPIDPIDIDDIADDDETLRHVLTPLTILPPNLLPLRQQMQH